MIIWRRIKNEMKKFGIELFEGLGPGTRILIGVHLVLRFFIKLKFSGCKKMETIATSAFLLLFIICMKNLNLKCRRFRIKSLQYHTTKILILYQIAYRRNDCLEFLTLHCLILKMSLIFKTSLIFKMSLILKMSHNQIVNQQLNAAWVALWGNLFSF